MKKGDTVQIDIKGIEADKEQFRKLNLNAGLSPDHPVFSSSLHDEIIKRVNEGKNPKITQIVDGNYANLKFDDGFECGLELNRISKV